MTTTMSHPDTRPDLPRLVVESFSLYDGEASVHFQDDPDLRVGCSRALGDVTEPGGTRMADQAGLVLLELGIDGERMHRVRVQRTGNIAGPEEDPTDYEGAFNYAGDKAPEDMLRDAVAALQAVLAQFEALHGTEAHQ